MAYELKELGWYDEDIKSISSSISGQVMTITITLQNDNTLDTTVTLPEATGAKVTNISNAIVDNKLTTTVTLSDGSSVTSEAVDLPTVNISGKQDKEINLTGFTAKTVEEALTEAKAAGETASTNLTTHINNKENPHGVTAAQVGLGNVNNTSDNDKPVSAAQQTALDAKLDKVATKTTSQQVYVKNTDGTQDMVDVSFDETGQTIVKRRNDGSIDCADGTDAKQAATVGQMNAAIANAQPYHIELTGVSGTLSVEQYNKLKADDNSYIIVSPTDVSEQKVKFYKQATNGSILTYSSENLLDGVSITILSDRTWTIEEVVAENQNNKTTTLSASSTNLQYPSAKVTYDYGQTMLTDAKAYADSLVGDINTALQTLDTGTGV